MRGRQYVRGRLAGWAFLVLAVTVLCGQETLAQDKFHITIYGFVQADYIQDFNRVDSNWEDTLRPSRIPTIDGEFGDDGQASMSAKQSRLGVMMDFPTGDRSLFTKFEFDMFGVGTDEGQTTIRLRHAYGEWGAWLAGQTNTLFMDASIFPNVVDYWGPAGMVFIRNPQIRWTPFKGEHNSFAVAIERPSNDIDQGDIRVLDPNLPAGIQASETAPDLTGQFRMQHDRWHIQIAGVARLISFDTADPDPNFANNNHPKDTQVGWGLNGTGSLSVGKKDKLLLGVVYGEGIATYMNDGGMDLAPESTGPLSAEAEAVPLLGVSAYYDHYWSDKYSTSFGYSQDQVENTDLQSDDAFFKGEYASVNFLAYPTPNMMVGAEGLWGKRTDNNGDQGEDKRIQITFHYSFSTKDIFKKN